MLTYLLLLSCCLLLILSGYNSQHLELVSLLLLLVSLLAYLYAAFVMTSTDYARKQKRIRKIYEAFKRAAIPSKRSNVNIQHGQRKGLTKEVPLVLIILCCLCLVTVPITIALAKYYSRYPIYTLENVKVISITPNGYWMEYESESVGHLHFYTRFCEPYTFGEGDYFELLRYEDRQSCWSLKSEHTGWKLRRDKYGYTASESPRSATKSKEAP